MIRGLEQALREEGYAVDTAEAGDDGLDIYRRLIPAAFHALIPGGFVVLEIGFGQSPAITNLLAASGFEKIEFLPDLQGIPRVASAQRS